MKRLWRCIVAAAAVSCIGNTLQAAIINETETAVFAFSSLPNLGLPPAQSGALVTVSLSGNLLDAGESILLNAYEDSLADAPFYSNVFATPTNQFGFHFVGIPGTWLDQQGVFTLTVLSGSIELSLVEARNYDLQGIAHSRNFDVAPVPLPAVWPLLAAAFAMMGWLLLRAEQKSGRPYAVPQA